MQTYQIDKCKNKIWTNEKGEYHRIDGPAVEWVNGTKFWYQNGQFHREDGHAIEYANGNKLWFVNGIELTKTQFDSIEEINGKLYMPISFVKKEVCKKY